uniref:Uncharacterized protein n=1 Tax=Anguilla anguilla TaxID=7936 RepID=A0A0E9QPG8_ANGAN
MKIPEGSKMLEPPRHDHSHLHHEYHPY